MDTLLFNNFMSNICVLCHLFYIFEIQQPTIIMKSPYIFCSLHSCERSQIILCVCACVHTHTHTHTHTDMGPSAGGGGGAGGVLEGDGDGILSRVTESFSDKLINM